MNSSDIISNEALQKALSTVLRFLPQIYVQREVSESNKGEIIIYYPHESLPTNIMLFVLPYNNSIDNNETNGQINKLTIRYQKPVYNQITKSYELDTKFNPVKSYKILVENKNGTKRSAKLGDILADRVCMFRFSSKDANSVILCNSPIYGDIQCNSLEVVNGLKLYEKPVIGIKENNIFIPQETLVTTKDIKELTDKVDNLSNQIKIGTDTPEKYFSEHPELPEGTIYIQTEE